MIKHLFKLMWNKKRQNALLGLEILLAFLILFGVTTFLMINLQKYREPMGYDSKNVLIVPFTLPESADSAQIVDTKNRLTLAVKNLDGVAAMSYGVGLYPMSGGRLTWNTSDGGIDRKADFFSNDYNFAQVMGLEFSEGHWFTKEEMMQKDPAMVVNQKFKEAYYPNETLAGRTIPWGGVDRKVTGVVKKYKHYGEFESMPTCVMLAHEIDDDANFGLVAYIKLKSNTPPSYEEEVDRVLQNSVQPWTYDIIDLDRHRAENSRSTWVFLIAMIAICAFLIFNVALGLFGVVWYNISKRRGEIGLRRALGATTGGISRHFIGETFVMATLAILVGLFFAGQLPLLQVIEIDLKIYLVAMLLTVLFIYTLVFICSIIPSQQAAQIHPATALHED